MGLTGGLRNFSSQSFAKRQLPFTRAQSGRLPLPKLVDSNKITPNRLDFKESCAALENRALRNIMLTLGFSAVLAAGEILKKGSDSVSGRTAALTDFFAAADKLIPSNPAEISIENLRAPFLGVLNEYIFRDFAHDVAIQQDTACRGAWVWSREKAPDDVNQDAVVVVVHGGGFISGDFYGYRTFCYHLSRIIGSPVLFPQYRLAPEHSIEEAVDDVVSSLASAGGKAGKLGRRRVLLVCDSAGASLALLAMQRIASKRDRKGEDNAVDRVAMPCGAVLLSPIADISHENLVSGLTAERDLLLSRALLEFCCKTAAKEHCRKGLSPLYGSLWGLPPLLVLSSRNEILFQDAARLCHQARASGVDVTEDFVDDLFHVYPLLYPFLPESVRAMSRMRRWMKTTLGK